MAKKEEQKALSLAPTANFGPPRRVPVVRVDVTLMQPIANLQDGYVLVEHCAGFVKCYGDKTTDGFLPILATYVVEDGHPLDPPTFQVVQRDVAQSTIYISVSFLAAFLALAHYPKVKMRIGGGYMDGLES